MQENNPIIDKDGTKTWYQNGLLHRDNDQPAVIRRYGNKNWFQNGKLHRDNDLPAIIHSDGSQFWYQMINYIEIMIYLQ